MNFDDEWKKYYERGYLYGSDALELVRFGWEMRDAEVQQLIRDAELLSIEKGQLKEELAVTDSLLEERNRLMGAIPECPAHGAQCVPHAIEWVEEQRRREVGRLQIEMGALEEALDAANCPLARQ